MGSGPHWEFGMFDPRGRVQRYAWLLLYVASVAALLLKEIFSSASSEINKGGHAQLFYEPTIAIPQLEGRTSAIAIPQLFKEILLRNCNSTIPQSQFFLMSATSSPQVKSFISAIFGIFLAVESGRFMKKNQR